MTNESALKRCKIENAAFNTRVTDSCNEIRLSHNCLTIVSRLSNNCLNFIRIFASNPELSDNSWRTKIQGLSNFKKFAGFETMTNKCAVERREIDNPTLQTRVTDACMGNLLDSYWINFTRFIAMNQEITHNPARTGDSIWIIIR